MTPVEGDDFSLINVERILEAAKNSPECFKCRKPITEFKEVRIVTVRNHEDKESKDVWVHAAHADPNWGKEVLGSTVMVNSEPVGHIEVVRVETGDDGEHLYRYRIYEKGSIVTYGVLRHKESEGAYTLLHKALGAALADRF